MVRGGLAVDRRYIARNRTVHTGYFFFVDVVEFVVCAWGLWLRFSISEIFEVNARRVAVIAST